MFLLLKEFSKILTVMEENYYLKYSECYTGKIYAENRNNIDLF